MKTKSSLFFGRRAILFYSLIVPLLRVLILTPLLQILTPNLNLASGVPYAILFFLSDLITLTALFAVLGLSIHAFYTKRNQDATLAFACQCASLVFVGVLLQAGIYCLLAFLDESFTGISFSLCNYSLNTLLTGGLVSALTQSFFGILLLLVILCISFLAAAMLRNRAHLKRIRTDDQTIAEVEEKQNPIRPSVLAVTAIFFFTNLINYVFETLSTLTDFDFNIRLSYLPTILSPYIRLMIYTVLCYYAVYFFATHAAGAALSAKEQSKRPSKVGKKER